MNTARKAILAAVIAGVGALAAAAIGDNAISLSEALAALSAAVVALGGVYGVTNQTPKETP